MLGLLILLLSVGSTKHALYDDLLYDERFALQVEMNEGKRTLSSWVVVVL